MATMADLLSGGIPKGAKGSLINQILAGAGNIQNPNLGTAATLGTGMPNMTITPGATATPGLPNWPIDPATGQPTIGPIPNMPPTTVPAGSNPPPAPQGGFNPNLINTGNNPNFSGPGVDNQSNDFGQWVSSLTPEQIAGHGGPMKLFDAWLQIQNTQYGAATNPQSQPQPWNPIHGNNAAPGVAGAVTNRPGGPAAPQSGGANPFLRYQTGSPYIGPPIPYSPPPGATTPPPPGTTPPPGTQNTAHPGVNITHNPINTNPITGGPVLNEPDPVMQNGPETMPPVLNYTPTGNTIGGYSDNPYGPNGAVPSPYGGGPVGRRTRGRYQHRGRASALAQYMMS